MKLQDLKDWALLGLITVGVYLLYDMKKSVEVLNVQVAVVIEKASRSEQVLNQHDERLRLLEMKGR